MHWSQVLGAGSERHTQLMKLRWDIVGWSLFPSPHTDSSRSHHLHLGSTSQLRPVVTSPPPSSKPPQLPLRPHPHAHTHPPPTNASLVLKSDIPISPPTALKTFLLGFCPSIPCHLFQITLNLAWLLRLIESLPLTFTPH